MADIKINDALNIVIPAVGSGDNVSVWAYHTPINREVADANQRLLAAVGSDIESHGKTAEERAFYSWKYGGIVAGRTLRDKAEENGIDATPLLQELQRLTVIIAPTAEGYKPIPASVAIAQNIIDRETWQEVESAIVFFTYQYALTKKSTRTAWTLIIVSSLDGVTTSLTPTDYAASLQTSTPVKTTDTAPPITSSATPFPT